MKIAVCVKQVPGNSAAMDTESGVLIRGLSDNVINPWDLYAIEAAIQAAEKTKGTLTAISMGPKTAADVLRQTLAMGAHNAVLLCDKAFAGADVYVTAFTLAQGIKSLGGFDLVFCGQQTTDGDTAQLPYSLAVQLDMRIAGWVKKIEDITQEGICVLQELSGGTQELICSYPVVVAVGREAVQPRIATLKNTLKAKSAVITRLGLCDMPNTDSALYGLGASPTRVTRVYENQKRAKNSALKLSPMQAAKLIISELGKTKHG